MPLVSTDFRILCCLQTTFLFGTDKSYAIEYQFDNLNGVCVMWTPRCERHSRKTAYFWHLTGDPLHRSDYSCSLAVHGCFGIALISWVIFGTILALSRLVCASRFLRKYEKPAILFSNNQRFSLIFFSDETQLCDIVRPPTRRIMCVLCTYCIILPFYIISAHFRPKCADILGYEHWTREFWSFLRPSDHDAHSNEVLVFFNAQVQPKHRQSTVRVD